MFVKMTARVPTDIANFKEWTVTTVQDLLSQIDSPSAAETELIHDFASSYERLAWAMMNSEGYLKYIAVEDTYIVYGCTIFDTEENYLDSIAINNRRLEETLVLRERLLDLFGLYVVEPILFEITSYDELTLERVRLEYYRFISEQPQS